MSGMSLSSDFESSSCLSYDGGLKNRSMIAFGSVDKISFTTKGNLLSNDLLVSFLVIILSWNNQNIVEQLFNSIAVKPF